MKKVMASDLFGTLVNTTIKYHNEIKVQFKQENRSHLFVEVTPDLEEIEGPTKIIHPRVYDFLNSSPYEIVICSGLDPKISERVCNTLHIPIIGAYSPANVGYDEEILEGGVRAYKKTKAYMERFGQSPIAYVTDKNLDALLTAYVFGKVLYCGSKMFPDNISFFCQKLQISPDIITKRIRRFDWNDLTKDNIKELYAFIEAP